MEELGALGNIIFTWACRRGRKTRFDMRKFTLELKLRPFKVYPYVCIRSHVFAMFGVPMCVIKKIARAAHA